MPNHIAIILDGNRRWAKRNLSVDEEGHFHGADAVENLLDWCEEFDIKIITLYVLSAENLDRKNEELDYIYDLIKTRLEKLAALDHVLTYFLITACCLSGYLSSSFSGWETTWWWLVNLPTWSAENDELNILFSDIHMWTCWALLAVIALHIGAALYHTFRNDEAIIKMFRL